MKRMPLTKFAGLAVSILGTVSFLMTAVLLSVGHGLSNGVILYTREQRNGQDLVIMDVGRRFMLPLVKNVSVHLLSPDRHHLAYMTWESAGYQCHVQEVGARAYHLNYNPPRSCYFLWSPDSQTLMVYSGRDQTGHITRIRVGDEMRVQDWDLPGSYLFWLSTWSPDGRYTLFFTSQNGVSSLYRLDHETDGLSRLTTGLSTSDRSSWRWSPDGRYAAMFPTWQADHGRILVLFDRSDGRLQFIPAGALLDTSIAWTPDSQRLVAHQIVSGEGTQLTWYDLTRSEYVPLTGVARAWLTDFSPDGRYLALTRRYARTAGQAVREQYDLSLMDVETGHIQPILENSGYVTHGWSPDGRYFAFMSYIDGGRQLTLLDTQTMALQPLDKLPAQPQQLSFQWSLDGRYLGISVSANRWRFYLLDVVSGEWHDWIIAGPNYGTWFWLPSGRHGWFYFSERPPGGYILSLDAMQIERIQGYPGADTDEDWSPDGRYEVFEFEGDLYMLDVEAFSVRQLTDTDVEEGSPLWLP